MTARAFAALSPLRPGAYEFQVVAMNRGRSVGPPSALAEFSVAGGWGTLGEGGTRLRRFLRPRDLPPQS